MYSTMIRGHSLATVSEASTTNATATSSGGAPGASVAMLSVATDEEVVVVMVFVRGAKWLCQTKPNQIPKNGNPLEMYFIKCSSTCIETAHYSPLRLNKPFPRTLRRCLIM